MVGALKQVVKLFYGWSGQILARIQTKPENLFIRREHAKTARVLDRGVTTCQCAARTHLSEKIA